MKDEHKINKIYFPIRQLRIPCNAEYTQVFRPLKRLLYDI